MVVHGVQDSGYRGIGHWHGKDSFFVLREWERSHQLEVSIKIPETISDIEHDEKTTILRQPPT